MHTVELLQKGLEAARQLGYEVRQDWLGGDGGGHCLVRGRKWLLLDLAQTPDEQLEVVVEALRGDAGLAQLDLPSALAHRFGRRFRRAA